MVWLTLKKEIVKNTIKNTIKHTWYDCYLQTRLMIIVNKMQGAEINQANEKYKNNLKIA